MKNILLIFALFIYGFGFSQTEVRAKVDDTDTLKLISVDDYLHENNEVTDLYFRHGKNTNWIKLNDGGRDLLKYYLSIDPDDYQVYKVYTKKLHKYYFVHEYKKNKRKRRRVEQNNAKAYLQHKTNRTKRMGEAVISYKIMEKFYDITLGRL